MSPTSGEQEAKDVIELERKTYARDLFGFCRHVVGYNQIAEETHEEWSSIFKPENPLILFLGPRGSLKSSIVTVGYSLQRLADEEHLTLGGRNLRITIVNATDPNASSFVGEIAAHLKENKRFRELYGDYSKFSSKWTDHAVTVERTKILKEPTLSAAGALGNIVCQHNDLIIVDDLCNLEDMQSKAVREKKIVFFQSLFDILEPHGQMIVIGSRWHPDDVYGFILKNKKEMFPDFKVVIKKAIKEDGTAYFPKKFPLENLKKLKNKKGTAFFNAQYQQDASGLVGKVLKPQWLNKFWSTTPDLTRGIIPLPKDLSIYQGIDLAISEEDVNAFFVICTVGISQADPTKIYLLDFLYKHCGFPTQIQLVKMKNEQFKPLIIGIENNAYQEAFPQFLRMDPDISKVPIRGIRSSVNKLARIGAMAPLFEFGMVILRKGMENEEFGIEYTHFPDGDYKRDLLDGLHIAIKTTIEKSDKAKGGYEVWDV